MSKFKILIADYEPRSIQKIQEILLKNFDCDIETASNGLAAFARFNELKPDLVLLEAMIPKKHGFEVCLDMKNSPQGRNTPVIITTHVYKGVKYKNQAIHIYKCDEYIEKPCPDEVIIETVKKFIPLSEEKVAAMKTANEKERFSPRVDQVSVETKKAEMPSDIEHEIASKVDEVLTLFAGGDLFGPAQKKGVERKQKKETKAKKSAKETSPVSQIHPEIPILKSAPSESATSQNQTLVETKAEVKKEIEASVETVFKISSEGKTVHPRRAEKTEEPSKQKLQLEEKRVPINILPEAPVKYKTLNFKMAVIGVSALAFLGIIIVLFPFITGKSKETKVSSRDAKADVRKNVLRSAPALPSPIVKPDIKPVEDADSKEESPSIDLPDAQTDAPKTSLSDQEASMKIKEEAKPPGKFAVPPVKSDDKKLVPPPVTEKKIQEKASAEKASAEKAPVQKVVEPNKVTPSDSKASSKPQPSESPTVKQGAQIIPEETQPKSQPMLPQIKESNAVLDKNAPPEKDSGAPTSESITPEKETPASSISPSNEPKQAESQPAVIINEGDIIEYSNLDREPGFLAHEMPKYPLIAKLRNIEGNVIIKVLIGTNGHIDEVQLVKGMDSSLDELAIKAATEWVYRPPTKNGIRVRTWKTETIPFTSKSE